MKYEIEIIKAYFSDKRIINNREIALRIFNNEFKNAIELKDNNTRCYLTKIYENGNKSLILAFDTYYSKQITKY